MHVLTNRLSRILLTLLAALALALTVGPAHTATSDPSAKRTVTYRVAVSVTSTLVVGPFSSTETVTADIVAHPTTDGSDPSAWQGEAELRFGPIVNSGLPAGCELTTVAPTGSMKVALVKAGENVEVTWSSNTTPVVAGVITCHGTPAPFIGGAPPEPFLLLEPKTFTVPAVGGTQQLKGSLSTDKGQMENIGTMSVTQRVECGQKVTQVNTYPPGQATTTSAMVGRGFAAGEKVTADTNVEFVFEDGSVARLAKGGSIKQDANCASFTDKSRSFKGTLLLGKVWYHVTKAFGGKQQVYEVQECVPGGTLSCVAGVRGTTFWFRPGKKKTTLSVSEGSVWLSRAKGHNLIGKRITVTARHTAVITKKEIRVKKLTATDAFPFG